MKIHLEVELIIPYREEVERAVQWVERTLRGESCGGWYIVKHVRSTMILPSEGEMGAIQRGEAL